MFIVFLQLLNYPELCQKYIVMFCFIWNNRKVEHRKPKRETVKSLHNTVDTCKIC